MEDLWDSDDLTYDALWTAYSIEEGLPDSVIDSIREGMEFEIDDHTDITVELPASATFEEVMKAAGKAKTEAERHNTIRKCLIVCVISSRVTGRV